MSEMISLSPETYKLLVRRAEERQTTPEEIAEEALRLQLGYTEHMEQKQTPYGAQAYVRGTRVAVRHVAAFLQAGYSAEEIIHTGLPHLPPAAIYEAIAYYYDHQDEIKAELRANQLEVVEAQLRERLSAAEYGRLSGKDSESDAASS